jgi:eukaryotic-like serine/threonine-protein kinase
MIETVRLSPGLRIASRFTLLEKLGVGGQAEVWRVRDETRRMEIALKIVPASETAWGMFEREFRVVSTLDHPGVLRIFPPQRDTQWVVLPMELAVGGDARRMRGASYLEIAPLLMEVAEALEHAHDNQVIHRDLKPSNILFAADGRALLADFVAVQQAARDHKTSDSKSMLSPFSASPQQLRGEPPAVTDDIYGLGALAYELLSGYPPYYPRFELKKVLEEPVPPLTTSKPIPHQFAQLLQQMLAKHPQHRPQTMRQVIDIFDSALNATLTFDADDTLDIPPEPVADFVPPRPPPSPPAATAPISKPDPRPVPKPTPWPAPKIAAVPKPVLQPEPVHVATPPPPPPPITPIVAPAAATPWDDLKLEVKPRPLQLELPRARRWPWAVLAVLALGAFAAFYAVPRYFPGEWAAMVSTIQQSVAPATTAPVVVAPTQSAAAVAVPAIPVSDRKTPEMDAFLLQQREKLVADLKELQARGAGFWGGEEFANAKNRAAESVGAFDAGDTRLALERLQLAQELMNTVTAKAPQALAKQLNDANQAVAAGQPEVARRAFELAQRIDRTNNESAEGLRRLSSLEGILPLLADGQNAESSQDYARAIQDYSQALALDPANGVAKDGLARANNALGADNYAKAIAAGYAALGAGRLDEARTEFERAKGIKPQGAEATTGLNRVASASNARSFASVRQRAAALEGEERWSEALREYEAALQSDPTLAFAQAGRARSSQRAELSNAMQRLLDEPERLAAPNVRDQAQQLIARANAINESGPVLRSQIARLEILLPEFDKTVRLALISDNLTAVAIQRVGEFGTFLRREVDLKPGRYVLTGRRAGFRDVRHEITISPGTDRMQTISVSCVEPI